MLTCFACCKPKQNPQHTTSEKKHYDRVLQFCSPREVPDATVSETINISTPTKKINIKFHSATCVQSLEDPDELQ